MKDVVIIGAGGHAREQLDLIKAVNTSTLRFRVLGFIVEQPFYSEGQQVCSLPILGDFSWLARQPRGSIDAVCAVGDSSLRQRLVGLAEAAGCGFPELVHPWANIGSRVELGPGVIVSAGAIITCDINIGSHTHINVGTTISHDSRIGSFSTLAPGVNIAGAVDVGTEVEIGVGATVKDRITIGNRAVLGAGAVAIENIPADSIAVGVPARVVKQRT